MAKCPAHGEKTGSLSITDMGQGKTRLHCFGGCHQSDVLNAVGLKWKDLRPDGEVAPDLKGRLADENRLEKLDYRFGLVFFLMAIDLPKRNYWRAAAKRIGTERRELRDRMFPEEKRARELQEKVRKVGWDGVVSEWINSSEGRDVVEQYGLSEASHRG